MAESDQPAADRTMRLSRLGSSWPGITCMKYFHLVWAALLRRRMRTMLMLFSVVIAFLLFGLLETVRNTFDGAGQTSAGRYRLIVLPKMGFGKPMPYSLLNKIKELSGVVGIDYASYLTGTYQGPKNSVLVEAHPESYYDLYPEAEVSAEALAALQRTRTGVLAGEALAKKYKLRVGDKIPLISEVAQKTGSTVWTFDVVGILRFIDPNMKVYEEVLFANWNYLNEARQSDSGTVGYYAVKVASISDVDRVAGEIDALTANSSNETKSQGENALNAAVFQQFGDMGLIVTLVMSAVFFTLLMLTGHAMAHAVHERIPELAVLKTIGFSDRKILGLVLGESIGLILLGALLGLCIATVGVVVIRSAAVLPIPILPVQEQTWAHGLMLAISLGLLVGAVPALRGVRLRIVDGLSHR